MEEYLLEPPETLTFGFYVNTLDYTTNFRLSPDDFSSKRSKSSGRSRNKQQSSYLAGTESQVKENKQIRKSGGRTPGARIQLV